MYLQVSAVPAAIQAMPLPKLQQALAKSIASLKARDRTIATLKAQVAATKPHMEVPRAQADAAEAQVADLVRISKLAGERHEQQVQELTAELTVLKQSAAEAADAKVRNRAHPWPRRTSLLLRAAQACRSREGAPHSAGDVGAAAGEPAGGAHAGGGGQGGDVRVARRGA